MKNEKIIMTCDRCKFSMEQENTIVNRVFKRSDFHNIFGKNLCNECYGKLLKYFIKFIEEKG